MLFVTEMLEDTVVMESLSEMNLALFPCRNVNKSIPLEFGIFDCAVASYMDARLQHTHVRETLVIDAEIGSRISRQPVFSGIMAALKSHDRKAEVSWFGKVSFFFKLWSSETKTLNTLRTGWERYQKARRHHRAAAGTTRLCRSDLHQGQICTTGDGNNVSPGAVLDRTISPSPPQIRI